MIARCTIGKSYFDPFYVHNFRTARENELLFLSYHVLWPWNRNPEAEVEWAAEQCLVDNEKPDGLVGDYELPNTPEGWRQVWPVEVAHQIGIHLPGLQEAIGRRSIAYSGSWWWGPASGHMNVFPVGVEGDFGWHEAEYFPYPPIGRWYQPSDAPMTGGPKSIPRGWSDWTLWQWTSRGRPIGAPMASNMDYNVFNGTVDELRAYLGLDPSSPISEDGETGDRPQQH